MPGVSELDRSVSKARCRLSREPAVSHFTRIYWVPQMTAKKRLPSERQHPASFYRETRAFNVIVSRLARA